MQVGSKAKIYYYTGNFHRRLGNFPWRKGAQMAAIVCARNIRKIIKYPFFDAEIESR